MKPKKLKSVVALPVSNKNKYEATFLLEGGGEKKIRFGAQGMRDFTLLNNKSSRFYLPQKKQREKIKENYQRRHKKDLLTEKNKIGFGAGALSYYLLWTTPKMNISAYRKRFNL